jgi:hypothetical protein
MFKVGIKIEDFILVFYRRESLYDGPPISRMPVCLKHSKKTCDFYIDSQLEMLKKTINQLNFFYPKSKIHLMTNVKDNLVDNVVYHRIDFESNNTAKFYIYSLLDKPAMYLDLDIIMRSPFNICHLPMENNFNFYSMSFIGDLQEMSKKTLPVKTKEVFNAGIAWIPRPSKDITNELIDINNSYFSDVDYMLEHGKWPCVDEYALAVYIEKHKIKMNLVDKINKLRHQIKKEDIKKYQTIHYNGIIGKELYDKEFSEINSAPSG